MSPPVPAAPPDGLVAAQRTTVAITEQVLASMHPGVSEIELADVAERLARASGATGVWTPVAAGVGEGNRVCHPDHPPTARVAAADDIVYLDLTPDFGGWPGDVTRSVVLGDDPARHALVADCLRLEQAIVAAARPGMPASELFGIAAEMFEQEELELLDLLGNIGHDLGHGAVVTGSIDATNHMPMWGAWAIEPHVGRDGLGAKFEDVVWLGPEGVTIVG